MSVGISPKLPVSVSKAEGCIALTRNLTENVKQNLKHLMLTNPGERVWIPDFGVGVRRYLFENQSARVVAELESRIMTQINTYMPGVVVKDLDVVLESQVLNIRLRYYIDGISPEDNLNLSLDVNSVR